MVSVIYIHLLTLDMIEGTLNFLKNLADQGPQKSAADAVPQEDLSKMAEFSIDEYRPMKVVVIGAGLTGVAAGIRWVHSD